MAAFAACLLTSAGRAFGGSAFQPSYQHPKFVDLWETAVTEKGATVREDPDLIVVTARDRLHFRIFTKPNHPAHPGYALRSMTRNADGTWTISTDFISFAAKRDDPAFLRWIEEFKALDRKMEAYLDSLGDQAP